MAAILKALTKAYIAWKMANNIPIIDFAQAAIKPDIIAEEVLQACTDWGKFAHRAVSNLKNLSCIDDAYAQASFMSRITRSRSIRLMRFLSW